MKAARISTGFTGVAAVVGLAIWLVISHEAWLRLDQEHNALENQLSQLANLMADNERLLSLLAQAKPSLPDAQWLELLRLRSEVGVLRQQTKELENARGENSQARAALQSARASRPAATADYWPRDSWAFAGYASPDAALQTSLWAANTGGLKVMLDSTTGEARREIEEQFAGKSEDEAAIRAMDEVLGLKSVRLLNREAQADDAAVVTALFEGRYGETQTVKLLMKKIGNDWKVSGPPQ